MKTFATAIISVLVGCLLCGVWSTEDDVQICTKCLRREEVVWQRVFGIRLFQQSTKIMHLSADDYERVFGHACEHAFHQWVPQITTYSAEGITCVGRPWVCSLDRPGTRIEAARIIFDAEKRLQDRELALASFAFVDSLIPPGSSSPLLHDEKEEFQKFNEEDRVGQLTYYIRRLKTSEQWRLALEVMRHDPEDERSLPTEMRLWDIPSEILDARPVALK